MTSIRVNNAKTAGSYKEYMYLNRIEKEIFLRLQHHDCLGLFARFL